MKVRAKRRKNKLTNKLKPLTTAIACKLLLTQHAIMVLIQVQVLTIHPQRRLGTKPIGLQMLFAQLLVPQLNELIEKAARQYLGDLHLAGAQGIEEEEELAHGSAHVERVEGALEHLELRQSRDQLEDVVLQVGLLEVAEAGAVVQREAYARLVQPELFGDVAEELVDGDAAVRVALEQFGENGRCEERSI